MGLLLTVAGVRNTQGTLFALVKGDFTGNQSFIWWSVSIIGVGALGYYKETRALANSFLALILIVLILAQNKNGNNLFAEFRSALQSASNPGSSAPSTSGASDPLASEGKNLSNALGAQ
jgi:hypothetical protein